MTEPGLLGHLQQDPDRHCVRGGATHRGRYQLTAQPCSTSTLCLASYLYVAPLLHLLLVLLGPGGGRGGPRLPLGFRGLCRRGLALVEDHKLAVFGPTRCRCPLRLQASGVICPEAKGNDKLRTHFSTIRFSGFTRPVVKHCQSF